MENKRAKNRYMKYDEIVKKENEKYENKNNKKEDRKKQ